ncbi:MAG TPA: PHP-associated domain-containing protein, partial [Longimicrobiales bacterium]
WFSADSINSPAVLVRRARRAGLHRIAVTDHGAMVGALHAAALDPELIIPGEEMKCAGGAHLIGLFLREEIPNGLDVSETAARIRDQGGVVYAPHPYAYLLNAQQRAEQVLAVADVVEVFNSRAFRPGWNTLAAAAAEARGVPRAAGTDAHTPWEIGGAYTEMPAFTDADSFRRALGEARPAKTVTSPVVVHAASITSEIIRRLIGRGHGRPLRAGQ